MIRNKFHEGAEYSIVDLGGARRVFATAVPRCDGTLREQTADALQTIIKLFQKEGGFDSIVMQTVFLREIEDQTVCRQMIREFYGRDLPATAYIPQAPCEGKSLSIEALGVDCDRGAVEIERLGEGMVVTRHDGITWTHLANVRPETATGSVYERSLSALQSADVQLHRAGLRFDNVIRTWFYLGGITAREGPQQRYRELNRARTDFYRNLKFGDGLTPCGGKKPVFPASTGIGARGDDLAISCIAIRANRPDVVLIPLENPRQTAACDYGVKYGSASPKFSRAMALFCGRDASILISGTASITGSATRHDQDAVAQIQESLDNIEALISEANLARHGLPGFGATLDDLAYVRVYLKRPEDYKQVRQVCDERLGKLPAIYALADICRPELLVEIEGMAFSTRKEKA